MSVARDVFESIAALLDNAGVGLYRPDGSVYLASEIAIVAKELPASPDKCIAITPSVTGDDVDQPAGSLSVQIRFRAAPGRPLDVNDMSDATFAVLQNLVHVQFGGVYVVQMLRESSIEMGMDDSKRWELADSYSIDTGVPDTPLRHY